MTGLSLYEQLMLDYLILSRYPILDFLEKKIILNLKIGNMSKTVFVPRTFKLVKVTTPMHSTGSFRFLFS